MKTMIRRLIEAAAGLGRRIPEQSAAPAAALEAPDPGIAAAQAARTRLEQVFDSMPDAVLVTDAAGVVQKANAAAAALLEADPASLTGTPIESLIAGKHPPLLDVAGARIQRRELVLRTRTGREVPVLWSCAVLAPAAAGTVQPGFVITAHDIAERKVAEQRIRYLARIDPLTKVPNRMQFQHLLQRAIARARRGRHRLALLYLDLDRFKEINDSHGHSAGDLCLETLTDRLSARLPSTAIIGRLAGDEFGVLLDPLSPASDLRAQVEEQIGPALESLLEPVGFRDHQLHISASIGVAFYPRDAGNVIDLIRNADAALFHAKRRGAGSLEYYHPDMNAAAVERLMLKSRLHQAFSRDELRVYYQPKVNLTDGRLVGAEALVRWKLAGRGLVLPGEFIPLAEESSLILDIGEWVLDRVCADLKGWSATHKVPGRISVNLSLRQLNQRDFIERIRTILDRHGMEPGQLEFEITESTMMENPQRTIGILRELEQMGLALAIDDFGTGYSSLSALQQFPISTLKIDQSFVGNVTRKHDQATIVTMIIEMGHSLEMDVVAEGVETTEELRFLRALNCDFAQGLLFGPVLAAEGLRELIARGPQFRYPTSSM